MLEPGQTVNAVVTQVAPFGVFLAHQGYAILVHTLELAWEDELATYDVRQTPGDEVSVVILNVGPNPGEALGSFKALNPERAPGRDAPLQIGSRHFARVLTV